MKNQRVLVIAIPAFFACVSAVFVALFNPELAKVVIDAFKDAPTGTPTVALTSTPVQPILSPSAVLPESTPVIISTETTEPTLTMCPWIPYIKGSSSDKGCLEALMPYGISADDDDELKFFLNRGRDPGIYGVCTSIAGKEEVKIRVELKEDSVSARFLISIAPEPVPNKSAYGFRIQPEIQNKGTKIFYVKLLEYTPSGYEAEKDTIEAIPDWKNLDQWKFEFSFRFTGSKVKAVMNAVPFSEGQVNSKDRYLCVAYQAMPTAEKAAHFEAEVEFP
jgi:hypothetical protein